MTVQSRIKENVVVVFQSHLWKPLRREILKQISPSCSRACPFNIELCVHNHHNNYMIGCNFGKHHFGHGLCIEQCEWYNAKSQKCSSLYRLTRR